MAKLEMNSILNIQPIRKSCNVLSGKCVLRPGFEPGSPAFSALWARKAGILVRAILPELYLGLEEWVVFNRLICVEKNDVA